MTKARATSSRAATRKARLPCRQNTSRSRQPDYRSGDDPDQQSILWVRHVSAGDLGVRAAQPVALQLRRGEWPDVHRRRGESSREEIDTQGWLVPGGGQNYEWRLREGKIATPSSVGGARPPGGIDPILDYPHTVGRCVTGGYVYRGSQIPALVGTYVFADYLSANTTTNVGRIFTLNYNGGGIASNFQDITAQLSPTTLGNYTIKSPTSFGEDANHELYITSEGNVFKIVPAK